MKYKEEKKDHKNKKSEIYLRSIVTEVDQTPNDNGLIHVGQPRFRMSEKPLFLRIRCINTFLNIALLI
jgi:hypothetical protein